MVSRAQPLFEAVSADGSLEKPKAAEAKRISWAQLLKRVFNIDISVCFSPPGGRPRRNVLSRILRRLIIEMQFKTCRGPAVLKYPRFPSASCQTDEPRRFRLKFQNVRAYGHFSVITPTSTICFLKETYEIPRRQITDSPSLLSGFSSGEIPY